jgi:hypothetical protein
MTAVSSVVGSYLRRIRADEEVRRYRGFPLWEEALGEHLAAVTIPEKILRNVLYVKVLDSVWVQELSLKKGEILKRLYEKKAIPPVDDVIFLPGNPQEFNR